MNLHLSARLLAIAAISLIPAAGAAQDVRSRTRPKIDTSTAVNENQAADLTLTLSKTSVRPVQTWIRTAGKIDASGRVISGFISPADGALIKVGQRVRAFPPESKSSMYQARVTRLVPEGSRVKVDDPGVHGTRGKLRHGNRGGAR
jgi:hypothetical protein